MKKLLILFFLVGYFVQAQQLQGRWIMAKDSATVSLHSTLLLEFKDSILALYDFDRLKDVKTYSISNDSLLVENTYWGTLNFIDKNRIEISTKDLNRSTFKTAYVRLMPTKSELSLEELFDKTYYYHTATEKDTIFLGIQLMARPEKLKRYEIEQIDSTLLLTTYKFGKRFKSMPILEATTKYLKLDGLPIRPYQTVADSIAKLPDLPEEFLMKIDSILPSKH